ncbi:MAG: CopD family protein [Sedimenticolaceae bacterium]
MRALLDVLGSIDELTFVSIVVKTLVYGTTLVAAGSALVIVSLKSIDSAAKKRLRWLAVGSAVFAALFSVSRILVRASFLDGGTWAGAIDPVLVQIVIDSPLGTSVALRLAGLLLLLALVFSGRIPEWMAAAGAVVVCVSFAFRGHALEDPRVLLGLLVSVHLLGLAFWIGVLWPLHRLSVRSAQVGVVASEFGVKAVWVVALLAVAGVVALVVLTGGTLAALETAYGQFFAVKLLVFTSVLGFAAWNKLRLTPMLLAGDEHAGKGLRGSIQIESFLIAAVLLVTAALTTLSSPA